MDIYKRADKALEASQLRDLEEEFEDLLNSNSGDSKLWFVYNEFRIANLPFLSKKRPQILLGGTFNTVYPNLHSLPLLEAADVVCLNVETSSSPYKAVLQCSIFTPFSEIIKQLPQGFEPDFFWANQVESDHFIPLGIETAPFPIVASICHSFLHKSVEALCELFDLVLPVSKEYGAHLRKKFGEKIGDLPFGLNWAGFKDIKPCWEKSVDVCLTFQNDKAHLYANKRLPVIELTQKFKEKYGERFVIEICPLLPRDQYVEMLQKSRIAINITGINGPYNYRTLEAMQAGSMIFQYQGLFDDFFVNDFGELFVEGVHGTLFNFENYESKLLHCLENRAETEKIAKEAFTFVDENYSYKKLYQKLIAWVQNSAIKFPRQISRDKAWHLVNALYYNQNDEKFNLLIEEFPEIKKVYSWIDWNNWMLLSNQLPKKIRNFLFLTADQLNERGLELQLYENALLQAPQEHRWIIHWNFLLLCLERESATEEQMQKLLAILKYYSPPPPFDESALLFRYYVNSSHYPRYQRKGLKEPSEFISLNIDLIKVIDDPQKRTALYHSYALKALSYFLDR